MRAGIQPPRKAMRWMEEKERTLRLVPYAYEWQNRSLALSIHFLGGLAMRGGVDVAGIEGRILG